MTAGNVLTLMLTLRGSKRTWFGCILVSVYIADQKPIWEGKVLLGSWAKIHY